MSKKDLVSAYFDGEMTISEGNDFLNNVSQDAELKNEFQFQSEIIEGLKAARVSELKAMLDAVPVGGGGAIALGKLAIIGGVLILSGLSYFYISNKDTIQPLTEPKAIEDALDELISSSNNEEDIAEEFEQLEVQAEQKSVISKTEIIKPNKESIITSPQINKPETIEPHELIEENNDEFDVPESGLIQKNTTTLSAIDIDVDNSKKKYSFHYQLKAGKLFLYGSFDKGLYEILEFNSPEGKILFLYYKDKYYGLSKNQSEIVPLDEVTEDSLISKLEAARREIKE
jgi:hypothetical protein